MNSEVSADVVLVRFVQGANNLTNNLTNKFSFLISDKVEYLEKKVTSEWRTLFDNGVCNL
jgi:hypothetical protein